MGSFRRIVITVGFSEEGRKTPDLKTVNTLQVTGRMSILAALTLAVENDSSITEEGDFFRGKVTSSSMTLDSIREDGIVYKATAEGNLVIECGLEETEKFLHRLGRWFVDYFFADRRMLAGKERRYPTPAFPAGEISGITYFGDLSKDVWFKISFFDV